MYYLNKQADEAFDSIQHLLKLNALKQNKRRLSLFAHNMIVYIKKKISLPKKTLPRTSW